MRHLNLWANIMIGVFGGIIISNLLRLSDISIYTRYEGSVILWLSMIILLIGIFLLVFKYYIRKVKLRFKEDERESAISDRSARNGLLANLPHFVHSIGIRHPARREIITYGDSCWLLRLLNIIHILLL